MSIILPSPAEAESLAVGPGSITWRRAGDGRIMLGAGAALVLQVSHPTVAAGVREHSNFREEPWGRLLRTLDFVNLMVYGGPERARRTAAAVRQMHQRIRGVDPGGKRYHALEPEAYAWVHATLAVTIVAAHRHFGRPLSPAERERFWAEWLGLGRMLGVREGDLPGSWTGAREYTAEMIERRLTDNDVVRSVLETLLDPARPPIALLGARSWKMMALPASHAMRVATVGLLPPALRRRLGLGWDARQRAELAVVGAAARAATPVLPRSVRRFGHAYLEWREDAIRRGPFASALASAPAGQRTAA